MSDSDSSEPAPARGPDGKFLPGNSGNPCGRPPGPQRSVEPARQLRRRVTAEVGGRARRMNIVDAVMRQLGDRALGGDVAAAREILRLAQAEKDKADKAAQAEAERLAKGAPLKKHNTYGFPYFGPEELEKALLDLDILVENEGRLFLRMWAKEAAFDRMDPDIRYGVGWRFGMGVDEHCI